MKTKTIIENKEKSLSEYVKALVKHKSLISSLVKKDLKSKYAQTKLGLIWMVIQPLIILVIFTVLFDQLIQLKTGSVPYPVFAFSGMLIWYLFTNIVQSGGNSLLEAQDIMKKIYFPKLLLPISKMVLSVIESSVSFILLIIVMVLFKMEFHLKMLLFPIVILLIVGIGLCLSIWLSALSVKHRDMQHFVPHVINTGIWLTPVFYPVTLIPAPYQDWLYYLNPVATVISLFRAILFDLPFQWEYCFSFIFVFVFLIAGILYFKAIERNITDYI